MYILILSLLKYLFQPDFNNETLELIHVFFRHGNRTVNGPEELYPLDPYLNETYYPVGLGQLTNAGKLREFSVGKALRNRYNDFLGDYYLPDMVEPRSSDFNRTKMSLELVLAGLFPPRKEQSWIQGLHWQPIPYNYVPIAQDKVMWGQTCPKYLELYSEYLKSNKYQNEMIQYKEDFNYISKNTGLNVTTLLQVYSLYFALSTEEEWGFTLPDWTKKVWPDVITNMAIQEYFQQVATTELSKMAVGYMLQRVVDDSRAKIEGKAPKKKIYLYSGHESDLGPLLVVLGIFDPPQIPNYGSYLTFEVHNINGTYGIKILYENYTGDGPKLLKLPACNEFCEFQKFVQIINEYLPNDDPCGNSNCSA